MSTIFFTPQRNLNPSIPDAKVLWTTSESYKVPQRSFDSSTDWLGEMKSTKKIRQITPSSQIATKETDAPMYEAAIEKLKNDSFALAELYLVKPNAEHARKRSLVIAGHNQNPNILFYGIVAMGIAGIFALLYILRRRKSSHL